MNCFGDCAGVAISESFRAAVRARPGRDPGAAISGSNVGIESPMSRPAAGELKTGLLHGNLRQLGLTMRDL
jgi:hypothetical protein